MRSSNPVLTRRGAFETGRQEQAGYGAPQPGPQGAPYGAPQQPPLQPMTPEQLQEMYQAQSAGPLQTGRMTIDDVVARTAMTLLTVVVFGALAWAFLPPEKFGFAVVASLAAFGVAMVTIFKKEVSPPLILTYAALQGFALGAISHAFETRYSGIVVQAVLGTVSVFVGVLFAYKSGWVKVTNRYYRIGMAIAIGFVVLTLVNLIAMLFVGGDGLGLRSGPLGIVMGILGILIGAFFLTLDFNEIEQLAAQGVPEKEAWRAAFALTMTLVWIYMEVLRLLSILRD
ncbi:Bax inhibitor-1/YccA family protein [Embleya sp. NBC_00896]|uniref:Bax inhibitor-1/YccA family protein n=1 Tax=Embleya sp. NBC_00896 TaxID=2975961 RepID=UPI0038686E27|nr:Bax inhibitor-1/YccA family protein [Embleya sp. NBC_00896]